MVGDVGVGGDNPIRVQSMITSDTRDTEACVAEILGLAEAGCEIVRVTAQTKLYAANLENIAREVRAGTLDPESVDEGTIREHLYDPHTPDPDLLIRTAGEMRVSNFLLWQIAYSEIWVTDTLWPDFRRKQFFEALLDYQQRERRYGGLAETESHGPAAAVRS